MNNSAYMAYGEYLDMSKNKVIEVYINISNKETALGLCNHFAEFYKYPIRTWIVKHGSPNKSRMCEKIWNYLGKDENGRLYTYK